jgi:diaminopimelate decarboxylase
MIGGLMRDISTWKLERSGCDLCWNGCPLPELARDYGTPLYVVNPDLIAECNAALLDAFRAEGLEAKLFFSYKTNPVPEILKTIAALGCGAEVVSEFEFWLAARLGVPRLIRRREEFGDMVSRDIAGSEEVQS